jgi:hypothetical protein
MTQKQQIDGYSRDVHGGAVAAVYFSLPSRRGAAAAVYFLLPSRRGAAAAASKKRKFKKLVNLHKIFILKNATL